MSNDYFEKIAFCLSWWLISTQPLFTFNGTTKELAGPGQQTLIFNLSICGLTQGQSMAPPLDYAPCRRTFKSGSSTNCRRLLYFRPVQQNYGAASAQSPGFFPGETAWQRHCRAKLTR